MWRTLHKEHAIERVRLIVTFAENITLKQLDKLTQVLREDVRSLQFNRLEEAFEGPFNEISSSFPPQIEFQKPPRIGWLFKLLDHNGSRVEELGVRTQVLGFFTIRYGGWEAFVQRLTEVMRPYLEVYLTITDVRSIRLEYVDFFFFEGEPSSANANLLLEKWDSLVPDDVVQGADIWHSNCGWFEDVDGAKTLINRNINVVDDPRPDVKIRNLRITTFAEARLGGESIDLNQLQLLLESLHKRTHVVFGKTLNKNGRDMVDLDLEKYQS